GVLRLAVLRIEAVATAVTRPALATAMAVADALLPRGTARHSVRRRPSVHPAARLIVTDGHQGLLDERHDVRILRIGFGDLTIHFHVCNHTTACNSTCNRKGFLMNTDTNTH